VVTQSDTGDGKAGLGRGLSGHSATLAVSESTKAETMELAGVPAERIRVVPNGVDPVFGADGPRVEGDYVLAVATLEPRKNLSRVVEAADLAGVQLPVVCARGWGRGRRPGRVGALPGPHPLVFSVLGERPLSRTQRVGLADHPETPVDRAPAGGVHEVGNAKEVRDEERLRVLVDLLRSSDLFDPPAVHDRETVRHGQRLLLVVCHVEKRDPDFLLQGLQLDLERLSQLRVERAQGLVEEEHRRVQDQRSRERNTPLPAAGEP